MNVEPPVKRTIAFVDGQNLFHHVKTAFGYTFPNYDVKALANWVCQSKGWQLDGVQFYTGVPSAAADPYWHAFWSKKLAMMGRHGVATYSRPLVYRRKSINVPGYGPYNFQHGEDKGIDVRLALDALHAAHCNRCDVVLIFSQDQDLSELAELVRQVSRFQQRWIKIACAFPDHSLASSRKGIMKTDWCPISKAMYDTCIDHRDYRPKPRS